MIIDDVLGLSKKSLAEVASENLVSLNNVNSTIELKDIKSCFDGKSHHVLFYFDLADNNIMTMAVLKFEGLTFFQRLKLRFMRNIQCKEYVGGVTFTGHNEAAITFVRENIIKAL